LVLAVQTVSGPIDKNQLGITSPHEHVYIDLSGFYTEKETAVYNGLTEKVRIDNLGLLKRDPYALRDNLVIDDESVQLNELAYFKKAGGNSVVDATTIGINRMPQKLLKTAEATGLNVICGTGFYVGATHDTRVLESDEKTLADFMAAEITEGIDGTGIRAGVIGEIGVSELFTASERKVLNASALAHRMTGAPVLVHINPWTDYGAEAAEILLDRGVSPDKLCICHVDVENRKPYIDKLLNLGVYIEFDNFGKEFFVARSARRLGYGPFVRDEARVELIKRLIDEGRLNQILLSCDVCLKILLRAYGGWGYDHVLSNILPMLADEGVTDDAVNAMLVRNPADYLDVV